MAKAELSVSIDTKGIREYIDSQMPEYMRALVADRDAALAAVQAVRDELDEKHRAELAKEGQRWAAKAEELYDALGVIMDICEHATPIAYDADGFVAAGYTVTVGAIHRALAYLQGALHKPPEKTAQTWAEFQAWLVDERERALGTVGQPQEDPSE